MRVQIGNVGVDRGIPYHSWKWAPTGKEFRLVKIPLPGICYYSVLILSCSSAELQYKSLEGEVVCSHTIGGFMSYTTIWGFN
jgi:hypothetical protein